MANLWTPEVIRQNTDRILDKLINGESDGCHLSRYTVSFEVMRVNEEDVLVPRIDVEYTDD